MSKFEITLFSIINVFVTVISIFLFAILTILSYKRKESDLNPEIILPTNSEVIKIYSVRPGTIDSGRDYEIKMAALLLLRSITQKNTKHAWLAMNVDQCGAFDDVVLYRKTNDDQDAIYLIQLKHEDKGTNIRAEEFKTKKDKGPFCLDKYFESISEIKQTAESSQSSNFQKKETGGMLDYLWHNHNNIVFVLFTNRGTTTGCDFLKSVVKTSDVDNEWMLYDTVNTTANGVIFEIDYQKLGRKCNSDQYFEQKFFLSTKQEHISKIDAEITKYIEILIKPAKISPNLLADVLLKFIQYLTDWSKGSLGGYYPLTKSHIVKKLTELLWDPYMVRLDKHESNQDNQERIWNHILEGQGITVINQVDDVVEQFVNDAIHNVLEEYCENSDTKNWWHANSTLIKKKIATRQTVTKDNFYMEAYHYLWKIGKIPLLLEVNNPESVKQVQDTLRFSSGVYRVVVLNKTDIFIEKVTGLKVFSNIGALNKKHQVAILRHPVTLQSRQSSTVQLLNLVGSSFKHITVKDIVYILSGKFNIGNEVDALPQFYEEMSLTRVWLNISVLLEVQNEKFVVKCENLNTFNSYLQTHLLTATDLSISSWQNIKTNPQAKIIIFDDAKHLKKIESYCLIRCKPFHIVLFQETKHLEWIKSCGTIKNIKPFRKHSENDSKFVMTADLVNDMVKNRKSTLISSHAGMGKSILINYIAHYAPSDWWVLKINLAEHRDDYRKWEVETPCSELFTDFIDSILLKQKCSGQLVKTAFLKHFNNKNVIFLLDGFDEVQVYYHVGAKKLIKFIHDAGFIMCLTTRSLLEAELESLIGNFAIKLNPFTRSNQTNFLTNHFSDATGVLTSDRRIESFVDSLLAATKKNLNDRDNEFAGIPLQTTLLAEVFDNDCVKYLKTKKFQNKHFDLLYLYENFIRKKINIALMKIEKITEDMIDQYKICRAFYALRLLFSEKGLKSLRIDEKLKQATEMFPLMVQLIQKDGIMVANTDNYVSFVHRTFGEYLAAEWLSENIDGRYHEIVKDLVKESFHPSFDVVRNIFDRMLAKDCPLHLAIIGRQVDAVKDIISSNVGVFSKADQGNRIFLHLIASWGLHHPPASYTASDMEMFKLRKSAADDDMTKIVNLIPKEELMNNNLDGILDYSPLDYAFASGSFNIANILCAKNMYYFELLKMVNDHSLVDYIVKMNYLALNFAFVKHQFCFDNVLFNKICSTRPEGLEVSPMHCAAEHGDIQTVLSNISDEKIINEVDIFTRQTPLHVAVISGQTEIVLLMLSNRADPNIQDFKGRTPLHWSLCRNIENVKMKLPNTEDFTFHGNSKFSSTITNKATAVRCFPNDDLTIASSIILTPGVDVHVKDINGNTALILAAYRGYTSTVNLLLSKGADKEAKRNNGDTALHVAANYGHADIVNILLSQGSDVEEKGNTSATALMYATCRGHIHLVNLLLSHGSDTEARNEYGNTALILAAQYGHTDAVDLLISHGSDIEAKNVYGHNALLLAASYGHISILKLLLSLGADKNAINNDGNTALMVAAARPYPDTDVVDLLLSQGLDTEVRNNEGSTLLIMAATNGHINTLKLLLSQGLDKETKNTEGNSALALAAYNGQTDLLKLLLRQGFDQEAKNSFGYTPLIMAACSGHLDILDILLSHGAEKEAISKEGETPLMAAANNGRTDAVRLLISRGSNKEARTKAGNTALIGAALSGHVDVVHLLLLQGADGNARSNDGDTALTHAARNGHTEVVHLLLAQGLDKDAKNNVGSTALSAAALYGHADAVNLLLAQGADKESKTDSGNTALAFAAFNGHTNVINLLLSQGADKEAKNNAGLTPLLTAASNGQLDALKLLLTRGADKEAKCNEGATALTRALGNGHAEMVSLLLSDKDARYKNGNTALTLAAYNGHAEVVSLLLSQGWDIEAKTNDGDTALTLAAFQGHTDVVKLLLSQGADKEAKPNNGSTALILAVYKEHGGVIKLLMSHGSDFSCTDCMGNTALLLATLHGYSSIVSILLTYHVDKEIKNNYGFTALMLAATSGHVEIVNLLLSHGANTETTSPNDDTALILAAIKGHVSIADLLISQGANKNSRNNNGNTALITAASQGHIKVVNLFLSQGFDIEAKNNSGDTPMIAAAANGHLEVLDLLLSQGADIEAKTNNSNTATTLAAYQGHTDVINLLLSRGANKEAKPDQGNTALISAAYNGHFEAVTLLLSQGSDKEARTNDGDTAVILAARQGHTNVVDLLLSQGLDKDARALDKNTALTSAAFNGHASTVSLLLARGVQKETKTSKGHTALTAAAINGHTEVANLLLAHGSDKEARTSDGDTALIIAASKGHADFVKLLLSEGSDKDAKNKEGETALMCAASNKHANIILMLSQK